MENSNILNMQTNGEQDKNNEDPERDEQPEANVDDLIISCSRKEDLVNIKFQITKELDVVDGG